MARVIAALLGCATLAAAATCPSNHDLTLPTAVYANACPGKGNVLDRLNDAKVDVAAVYVGSQT